MWNLGPIGNGKHGFKQCLVLVWVLSQSVIAEYQPDCRNNIIYYYGQQQKDAVAENYDPPSLGEQCNSGNGDVFVISSLPTTVLSRGNGYPILDLKEGTEDSKPYEDTNLKYYPQLSKDIKYCQSKGKKILLSIGGGEGVSALKNNQQAEKFAKQTWELFGPNTTAKNRPFGDAVVDGFDLDVGKNKKQANGYNTLIQALRLEFEQDQYKKYLLSGVLPCDIIESPPTILQAMMFSYFDWVVIKNYDPVCKSSPQDWDGLLASASYNSDVKMLLGVPSYQDAHSVAQSAKSIYDEQGVTRLAGIMVWGSTAAFTNSNNKDSFAATLRKQLGNNKEGGHGNLKKQQQAPGYGNNLFFSYKFEKRQDDDDDCSDPDNTNCPVSIPTATTPLSTFEHCTKPLQTECTCDPVTITVTGSVSPTSSGGITESVTQRTSSTVVTQSTETATGSDHTSSGIITTESTTASACPTLTCSCNTDPVTITVTGSQTTTATTASSTCATPTSTPNEGGFCDVDGFQLCRVSVPGAKGVSYWECVNSQWKYRPCGAGTTCEPLGCDKITCEASTASITESTPTPPTTTGTETCTTPKVTPTQAADCSQEGLKLCPTYLPILERDSYWECVHSQWLYRPCGGGTVCKQVGCNEVICDHPPPST